MAGTPKPIGRVLLMPKGDYNATAIYYMLDLVRYNDETWVCKVDGTTGVTPVEGTDWSLIVKDGADGTDGTDGADGVGITKIEKTGVDPVNPLIDIYTITYTDGTTSTFNVTNGASGGGGGDMYESKYVNAGGTGVVLKAKELYDATNNKSADTTLLTNLSDDGTTGLKYKGAEIGGKVSIDDSTIVENASGKLEVPIDNTTLVIDSTSKKMKLADSLSAKLSKLDSDGKIDYSNVKNKTAIENPSTKSNGQVLTYNGSAWIAQTPQSGSSSASGISYSNTTSGLTSTNVQGAIDEVSNELPTWSSESTSTNGTTVSFTVADTTLAYDLYCKDKLVGISSLVINGSTFTYTVSGASAGDKFRLRIIK